MSCLRLYVSQGRLSLQVQVITMSNLGAQTNTYEFLSDPVEISRQPVNVVKRYFQSGHKRVHPILDGGGRMTKTIFPPPGV